MRPRCRAEALTAQLEQAQGSLEREAAARARLEESLLRLRAENEELAEALELSWKTTRHGADLHKALHAHLRHRVKVLERVHARGLDFV